MEKMKILIISDGKYGDRAINEVQKKFPSAKLIIIREENPTMFLDEVNLEKDVESAIEDADLLILYVRHPDVVYEICMRQKPTILPVHLGEGFLNDVKSSNPKIAQPISMCNALPNTGISEIDNFFKKFGSPVYKIKFESLENNQSVVKEVSLLVESPCGSSNNTLKHLLGKPLTPELLNNFAMSVRQECREPMSVIFKRDFSETAGPTHLLKLLDAIEKEDQSILLENTALREYATNMRKNP